MVKVALDYAVNAGHKIQPLCPIVKLYVDRHRNAGTLPGLLMSENKKGAHVACAPFKQE
jgi:hypothetical protein